MCEFISRVTKLLNGSSTSALHGPRTSHFGLEYCSATWSPPQQHLWERLESVQRRATLIICGTADGSYDARLVWVPLVGDPPREATGLTDARTVPDARWTAFRDLVVLRSADKQKNWAA
ncbi:uncharacterized protein ISCGN_023187 [Ixodes scapularis]